MDQKLLIVDDEVRLAESLKFVFENKGFSVQTSSNGLEAIETFKRSPVTVILTDIQMPEMNGYDLMTEVRRIDPFVQLIFLTGYGDMENAKKAFKNTAFDFFLKPVSDNAILFKAVKMADVRYHQLQEESKASEDTKKALSISTKIFDSLEAVVYASDMGTYELLYTNKKFNTDLGYKTTENLVGKKCWEVIQKNQTGPCSFCTNSRIVDENGLPAKAYEWEFCNENNNKTYQIVDKAIEWFDGKIVRLETAYDITEKKKYEKLFKTHEKTHEKLKKLESISTLAGGIAHQFNNSLSVITGHLELIGVKFPEDPQFKNHIQIMMNSTEKMTQLTASLLAYARGGKYQTQSFVFSKFIEETLENLTDKFPSTITLITDFSEKDHYINADKTQIRMLLTTILDNAFEAIDKIGTIKVICEQEEIDPKDFDQLNLKFGKEYVCLTIMDDGQGMDNEAKNKIFEPFFTTKFSGRGLGLSAAYGIVKNHKGFISVNSKLEKGTTIKVFLPIHNISKAIKPKQNILSARQLLTILIIEDEESVMDVLKLMLKRMGHNVLTANTGEKAIKLVTSYKGTIHLALLDFILPDMNGDIIYPFLVKNRPEMDTIVLSGYAITEPVQKILNAGAKAFMQKPVTMAELSEKITKVIDVHRSLMNERI
ncbi:MAG: response regulator [Desulfobacula sp.]|nr:response regulator [Desulfobacula sp.]